MAASSVSVKRDFLAVFLAVSFLGLDVSGEGSCSADIAGSVSLSVGVLSKLVCEMVAITGVFTGVVETDVSFAGVVPSVCCT